MDSSRLPATITSASVPPLTRRSLWAAIAAVLALVIAGLSAPTAFALSNVAAATFESESGTVSAGMLSVKTGASVTLTLTTSSDTRCVEVKGSFSTVQTSPTAKSSWTITTTASAGDGLRGVTAGASDRIVNNANGVNCGGQGQTLSASYTVDNTPPLLTANLRPRPNAAGWNNTDTTVTWTATDAGAGVESGPTPASEEITTDGISSRSSSATDQLGNTDTAYVTVRVDKTAPTITASQVKNADGTTTITFTCSDSTSGIATCLADGSTTNSASVGPNTTVTGTATDAAGNTATATSTAPAGDTTAPVLTGTPTPAPNDAGWYSGDVTIDWTASDPESGIPTPPADTTITGEGTGLTSTLTVNNGAGLSTTATSSPAVSIDRTKPTTEITGTANSWVGGDVVVQLTATDNLSGVDYTEYAVDGAAPRTGTSFTLSAEGAHTITFRSVDKAGNAEAFGEVIVRIDKTAPTIGHRFTPDAYTGAGWLNQDVTVTFECADQGGSHVASCSDPVDTTAEGIATIIGTAVDGAGNSASDSATVRIDKTAPTLLAALSAVPNGAGWYHEPVTVTYTAGDTLSGVAGNPEPVVIGEGRDQSRSATVTDAAGNSTTAGVDGIHVDLTPPTLTGAFPPGWSTDDVTVTWTCTDALSGVTEPPSDTVVSGEGGNLSSTQSCTDAAGNSATTTVDGIRIDRSAPTTQASVASAGDDGWYETAVEVTLTGSDTLSGVASTAYTVDGGAPQDYTEPFSIAADGEHTVAFWSTDAAGNVETAGAPLVLKVDATAPTTTVINPISPATGWFVTSGIPFAFDATDGHSGVAATYYTIDGGDPLTYGEPFAEDLSTGTHEVTYWSVDRAGNSETVRTITINVDTIAPTITGEASPAPNASGWNNDDVAVTFTCEDTHSGIDSVAGCAGHTVLTNEGAGQKVTGDALDVAGNKSTTVFGPVNIDRTRPTLVGVLPQPNAAGWYKDDVQVAWVGDDALSGIDSASQPEDSIITGEGHALGAGPVTISDEAGNRSLEASVTGVKIDRTAPVVTGATKSAPNAAGWHSSAVTVDFTCSDALSGVASCPTSTMLSGNGAGQSVTSGLAEDLAGNASLAATVGGINIDGAAPTSSSNNSCRAVNDWCTGDTADVVLTATDQAGLSGVKEIRYRVDGGTEEVAAGSTVTVRVPLTGSGAGTVSYYAVDKAGNAEAANSVALKWDNIAPTVSHALSPAPNADGWNNADVTVTFTAKDDDKGSGVDPATLTAPVTVTTEAPGQTVVGSAKDKAGNTGSDSAQVSLDRTKPIITAAITAGALGAGGWYTGPVTVTFGCSDALSGVATCPDPVVLTHNGENAASGTVTDKAGNTATVTLGGIRIDQESPTLTTADVNVQGGSYPLGTAPAAGCTATDGVSGVASCTVTVTGGNANGVGTFTYSAVATDTAGNRTTVTGTYTVTYRFDGFLQPINDTAHQVGTSTSIFKAGSTVPVKLQLKSASGAVVQPTTAPIWVVPVKGSATSAPVDESVYALIADNGGAFRYDATAQQYIYNWKTGSTGGNYWRIGVKLDDGQTYYVNIGLR